MARRRAPPAGIVINDALWTWGKRGCVAAGAVGAALWYAFQFYSQVQTLGGKVDALWQGQGTIMQTIADVKTSIAQIAQQGAKGKGAKQ